MSEKVTIMYSCCSPPALRQVRMALLMCWPVAQASISLGVALFTVMVKWKSCMLTLPAPPPPPPAWVPVWVSPQLHDWTSISFLCLASVDSPSMPSTFRKKSTAAIGFAPALGIAVLGDARAFAPWAWGTTGAPTSVPLRDVCSLTEKKLLYLHY